MLRMTDQNRPAMRRMTDKDRPPATPWWKRPPLVVLVVVLLILAVNLTCNYAFVRVAS